MLSFLFRSVVGKIDFERLTASSSASLACVDDAADEVLAHQPGNVDGSLAPNRGEARGHVGDVGGERTGSSLRGLDVDRLEGDPGTRHHAAETGKVGRDDGCDLGVAAGRLPVREKDD